MAPEIKEWKQKTEDGLKFKRGISNKDLYDAEKADVYSLGITFGAIALLGDFDARFSVEKISRKLIEIKQKYPKLHKIVENMTREMPDSRSDFKELSGLVEKMLVDIDSVNVPFVE